MKSYGIPKFVLWISDILQHGLSTTSHRNNLPFYRLNIDRQTEWILAKINVNHIEWVFFKNI